MGLNFDRWTFLKIVELGFAIACLICKRVTDDEASKLFLYLRKLSREWSLLNNVTWDQIGATAADVTYGGYVIITASLLIGRVAGELPTTTRITEMVLLGLGALLFIILGSLEFAAIDSLPPDLLDNAAVLGTLSLATAALFLLDLGGPKAKRNTSSQPVPRTVSKPAQAQALDVEKEISSGEKFEMNGFKNGQNGYKKMKKEERPKRFDIYGKDGEIDEVDSQIESHSPVWSKITRGQYGRYDAVAPTFLYPKMDDRKQPSSPADPGYVQYTAKNWGQSSQKTPRHSPTQV